MSEYEKPIPRPTPLTQPFWDGVRAHELRVQKCSGCGALRHLPKPWCPDCLSAEHTWVSLSGRGQVYTYTVMHRAPHTSFQGDLPYVVAFVELEEGVRMISNLVGCPPEQVRIGMSVQAVYEEITPEMSLFKFSPA